MNELVIASATDPQEIVNAAADNDEAAARVPAPKPEVEQNDGSSTVSFEHPRSERAMLLERLQQHERDLEDLTGPEQVTASTETAEMEPTTEDAITQEVRRQQEQRDDYYRAQQNQHLAQPQAQIEALRAELLPGFQSKVQALLADADVKQLEAAAHIPLSEQVLDTLLTLPGGSETCVFLLKNAAEVKKLSSLPAHMAIARVAQLANRFDPALQRRPSNAPAPIRPVSGSSTRSTVVPDELPYQEFKKFREREIAGRRR